MSAIQEVCVDKCSICLDGFDEDSKKRYTHPGENGKKHGFHKECLKGWVKEHSSCPTCQEAIDPSSLASRTERVVKRLKPALTSIAYVAGAVVMSRVILLGLVEAATSPRGVGLVAGLVVGAKVSAGILKLVASEAVVVGLEAAQGCERTGLG